MIERLTETGKKPMNLETFLFQHFNIISCLTKTADTQRRSPVTESATSQIRYTEITVSKRLNHRPNLCILHL